jgi:PAS domain S-box-containing protein
MTVRYTDLKLSSSGAQDFVIRQRIPTALQFGIIFLVVLLVAFAAAMSVVDRFTLSLLLAVLLGLSGWYMIFQLQRDRDLLLATEFQNALFSSALGLNNKFSMIIRRDGGIIYMDRAFQEMFPDFLNQSQRTVDSLLEHGKVSPQDREKIFNAIDKGVYEKVVFQVRESNSKFTRMVMSVEPILRPSGFILLRGREFIESRTALDMASSFPPSGLMSKHTITLFSYVMDTMNMGVYMTAPTGNIIYVNPVLEQWLGYSDGEVVSKNFSLQDIIHQNGTRPESIEPDNFEGEVMLQKKNGGLMKSFINQKIIRDEDQKIVGCTALVHHFVEQTDTKKKKLW